MNQHHTTALWKLPNISEGLALSFPPDERDRPVDSGPAAASSQGSADRRDLALIAFERTRMAMVVTDPRLSDNPIALANAAFLEMTGCSAEEVIGKNLRFLHGPETDPVAIAEVSQALSAEEEITIEIQSYRKDGSTFWNEIFASPITDEEGKLLYYFLSLKDVSQRREAREKELDEQRLLREIDHRAKNALALVQGFVRLGRLEDTEDFAASVQSRVNALARAHSMLAAYGWRGVPLMRLVQGEAEPFGADQVISVGPETLIGTNQVQPVSLFLREMFSNASKHGALSIGTGEVVIRWRHENENHVVIEWQERGGPAPEPGAERSLGSNLIEQIINRQLRGHSSMDWARAGLKASFRFQFG